MGITRADAESKINAQRWCIREHIEKYERYEVPYDKERALKTIQNCQNIIEEIKQKCEWDLSESWEDNW